MTSYSTIIRELIDEFTPNVETVKRIVRFEAEKYRADYYAIVDVDEDDFDKGELMDFFEEVRAAIREALEDSELI